MCRMTGLSRGCDSSNFDGNTNLVGSDDNGNALYSGFEIIKFGTKDYIIDFTTLLDNNLIPTAIPLEKNTRNL